MTTEPDQMTMASRLNAIQKQNSTNAKKMTLSEKYKRLEKTFVLMKKDRDDWAEKYGHMLTAKNKQVDELQKTLAMEITRRDQQIATLEDEQKHRIQKELETVKADHQKEIKNLNNSWKESNRKNLIWNVDLAQREIRSVWGMAARFLEDKLDEWQTGVKLLKAAGAIRFAKGVEFCRADLASTCNVFLERNEHATPQTLSNQEGTNNG